jgi:hypothetical protein
LTAARGLDYGHDVLFTYGPLGFLSLPLAVSSATLAGSLVFALLIWLAISAAALKAALRSFSAVGAVAVSYLVLLLPLQLADAVLVIAFMASIWALEQEPTPQSQLIVIAGGALAGFALLIKLNSGLTSLLVVAVAAWRLRPGRLTSEALLVGSCGVSIVVSWLLSGNSLAHLPAWLHGAQHVISGYTDAAALESPTRRAQYVWALALIVAGIILLGLHLGRKRLALSFAAAAYTFAFLKEGFVRHDSHDLFFFGGYAFGLLAFGWRTLLVRSLALATVLTTVAAVVATPEYRFRDFLHPVSNASTALDDIRLVADNGRRRAAVESARAAVRAEVALPSRTLARLRGHTVDVVPFETSIVWAYGLPWRPEPVLQDYAAYDAYLDRLNAREIELRGAQRILRQQVWPAPDDTHPVIEAPATFLARLCHYREISVVGNWEVLARTSNRCGTPQRLQATTGRTGRWVVVPPAPKASEVVYARISLSRSFGAQFENALLKPLHLPRIVLGMNTYRFISATASDPLVLRLPTTSEISPSFGGSVDYGRFMLENVASPFRVEFYAVRIRGQSRSGGREHPTTGRIEQDSLIVGRSRVPLVAGAVDGFVDAALDWGRSGAVVGWALDKRQRRPVDEVAVFVDGTLAGLARPSLARPDVAAFLHAQHGTYCGYRITVRVRDGASVRVFGIARGRATELNYGAGDVWPHGP